MNESTSRYRQVARLLLACDEADAPRPVLAAALEFLEDLTPVLANLVGSVGLRAMEGRALRVTRGAHPVVERIRVGDGADGLVDALSALAGEVEAEELAPAATDLVAHLVELLVSLLGEPIALRMLRRVRPDLQMDRPVPRTDDRDPQADDRDPQTDHRDPQTDHRDPQTDHRDPQADDPAPQMNDTDVSEGPGEAE